MKRKTLYRIWLCIVIAALLSSAILAYIYKSSMLLNVFFLVLIALGITISVETDKEVNYNNKY